MSKADDFATKEFGWTQDDLGDSDLWLTDMQNMLEREVLAVESNSTTPKYYGYHTMTKQDFLKINENLIVKIKEALK